jgi:signal transduction histidine kinase/ActR/RegA family two-component response regulator
MIGAAVCAFMMFSLMGYLFGAQSFYAIPSLSGIALQTATMLLALAIGLIANVPEHQPMLLLREESTAGMMARSVLPALVIMIPSVIWLRDHGENLNLYDACTSRALGAVALIFGATALMWTALLALRRREQHERQSEAWLAGQKEALQAAVNGETLDVSLGVLVHAAIEHLGADTRAAFCLVKPDGANLDYVVGESEIHADFVDGLKIGSDSLACGLAVHTARPVINRDVRTEPLWKPWLWLAEKYEFRGCWSFPIETSAGRVVGTFALYLREPRDPTSRDEALASAITQTAAIVIAQDKAVAALRESDRRKDDFLATLAHELRNPLAPITTGLEIMKALTADSTKLDEIRRMMERQTNQLVTLVDDLLEVSRIKWGKLQLRKRRVRLIEIVQSALEASQPLINEAKHELQCDIPAEPIELDGDPNRLAQVISNLLSNAAKYTPKGGRIRLAAERRGGDVVISVKDTGIGIPAEMQENIFEMFAQAKHPLQKGVPGLGIGLALVKSLIEMHEGSIEVHSDGTGKGSEFRVRLPIQVEPPLEEPQRVQPEQAALARQKRRVLVVDDNQAAARMLGVLVEMLGHEARTAYSGFEGIQAAQEFQPDLIFLDIGMPKMDGFEAARRIRQQPWGRAIRLVALTGWGYDQDKQRAKEAGFDQHLVKPATTADLQQAFYELELRSPTLN